MATLKAADAKAVQTVLGVKADGKLTYVQIAAIQTKLGVKVDGVMGPVTISAIQGWLGIPVDGKMGPVTRKAALESKFKIMNQPLKPIDVEGTFTVATIKVNTHKLAVAAFGIAVAALFAYAARR
jgi:peptidoglycan hydrolase-like protein with peptidoglycan-binding domain